jgi:hypothetical protein
MEQSEIDNRFTYHEPKSGQSPKYVLIRDKAKSFAELINDVCPESRVLKKALAFTQLEDAVFWANASIARRG